MKDLSQFVEVLFYSEIWQKKWVVCSLRSFGTLKYDCVIKIREIFNFLPLKNNSVTIEFSFVLSIISAIISSKTIKFLFSISGLYSSIFL